MRIDRDHPTTLPLPALRRVFAVPTDQPARLTQLLAQLAQRAAPAPDQA
jgi:hypothetical protein